MNSLIFCPIDKTGVQIEEFDPELILSQVKGTPDSTNLHKVFVRNKEGILKEYQVNLGASRYHILKKSRQCACCGIIANKCYLDRDEQNSKELGKDCYHFNFYAETGELNGNRHLILMTRDHIVARAAGGDDSIENSQTLCYNCNGIKGATNFTIQQMQNLLFPAYRAYKSSFALKKTHELLYKVYYTIEKNRKAIDAIRNSLKVVSEEKAVILTQKIATKQAKIAFLEDECRRIELEAQVTGQIPTLESVSRKCELLT